MLALGVALVLGVTASPASAQVPTPGKAWGPGKNRAFHGVSDTGQVEDFREFRRQVRAHPALLQMFFHWDVPLTSSGALHRWSATRTRGVLSLSTAPGGGEERITPGQIANGLGDHYILRLNETIANREQTVYVRLMAEMNAHWNPYSKYNADGTARGGGRGTIWYKRAWRRFATIIRGGRRAAINRHLRRNKMPRIHRVRQPTGRAYNELGIPAELPRPRVAMMWVPQTIASPNVRGNQPANYWPGRRYVDWVGADIYSKWATPGVWAALDRFFRRWRRLPFVIGEYSPYDNDTSGAFVRRLFQWAENRPKRVKISSITAASTPRTPTTSSSTPALNARCAGSSATPATANSRPGSSRFPSSRRPHRPSSERCPCARLVRHTVRMAAGRTQRKGRQPSGRSLPRPSASERLTFV
jgi:hypothetical protein